MHYEKIQLDQFQNSLLLIVIYFDISDKKKEISLLLFV